MRGSWNEARKPPQQSAFTRKAPIRSQTVAMAARGSCALLGLVRLVVGHHESCDQHTMHGGCRHRDFHDDNRAPVLILVVVVDDDRVARCSVSYRAVLLIAAIDATPQGVLKSATAYCATATVASHARPCATREAAAAEVKACAGRGGG